MRAKKKKTSLKMLPRNRALKLSQQIKKSLAQEANENSEDTKETSLRWETQKRYLQTNVTV